MTKGSPLVSILVPVYNAATHLPALISSVKRQTYANWELIFVDDCSTDESLQLLQRSFSQDSRIRVEQNRENKGPSATLNLAASLANGNLFARLDADDTMEPDRLEVQIDYLGRHADVGLLGSFYRDMDEEGKSGRVLSSTILGGDAMRAKFLFSNPLGHSTVIFRREIFERVGGYDERLSASLDYDFLSRLSKETNCACIPRVLVNYRTHGGNITSRKAALQLQNAMMVQAQLLRHYGFRYSEQELHTHYCLHLYRGLPQGTTTVALLGKARSWLLNLRKQNSKLKAFEEAEFDKVLREVHTGLYARKLSKLRLRDYLSTFTTDFGSTHPRESIIQLLHTLKNGL